MRCGCESVDVGVALQFLKAWGLFAWVDWCHCFVLRVMLWGWEFQPLLIVVTERLPSVSLEESAFEFVDHVVSPVFSDGFGDDADSWVCENDSDFCVKFFPVP